MSLLPYVVHRMVVVLVSLSLCMTITRSYHDEEKQALIDIKANLVDKYNNLKNWGNTENDCCQWWGVGCDNKTGHVVTLDLSLDFIGLSGNISSQLPLLSQLQYLDLSRINFELNHIPSSLSSLTTLKHLTISNANLGGSIPRQLANLSNLIYLDLSNNSLSEVIPNSFGDLKSLTNLDLSDNCFEGVIPKSFGNLLSLVQLDLSKNHLSGPVPAFLGFLSLHKLDLSMNGLTGNLPISVGKLSNLEYLDVSSNYLEGLISDDHFLTLTKLTYLDLSFNSFALNLSSYPRFKLKIIKLQSCKLGPSFPMWIQTQKDFAHLDISNASISDYVPKWFWDLPPGLNFLNLSSNEIKGTLPNITSSFNSGAGMDLSNNQLEGMIHVLPTRLAALNLSGNRFSGTLAFVCQIERFLTFLDLSNNFLSGNLPDCWQNFQKYLVVLNLSNNSLSGEIPSSMGFLSQLQALYLRRNAFYDEIPRTLINCTKLRFVDLGENKLSGNIPSWIGEKLSELYVLVLHANRLNGSLPSQICLLSNLQFLDLSANGISGTIPKCFGNFTAMATTGPQDVIMSHSYSITTTFALTGPTCRYYCRDRYDPPVRRHRYLVQITYEALVPISSTTKAIFIDKALVAWKGTRREFGKGLYLMKSIDISSNKLYGKLPDEITNLLDLVSLNVSNNKLHGQVPKHMGRLISLESLDLSRNEFSGKIPSSLSEIATLSYLDLSYNNLSGRIPTGTQLQGFNSSAYIGNPQLYGCPLTQSCGLPPPPPPATVAEKDDDEEDGDQFWKTYYTGMGAGFAVGFSGICGTLYLNRPCRFIFFGLLITMKDWIYVTTVVHFRNLHMKFKRS